MKEITFDTKQKYEGHSDYNSHSFMLIKRSDICRHYQTIKEKVKFFENNYGLRTYNICMDWKNFSNIENFLTYIRYFYDYDIELKKSYLEKSKISRKNAKLIKTNKCSQKILRMCR